MAGAASKTVGNCLELYREDNIDGASHPRGMRNPGIYSDVKGTHMCNQVKKKENPKK